MSFVFTLTHLSIFASVALKPQKLKNIINIQCIICF
ncbi:Uncharacterised protein [Yersinia aldovae]|uniref:Uncharacterized protein n=1 Tax=Yersinia aldovae TaxID=29483 RepID=A0A0T9T528_YERAL|nr:Uncharacterised protein [Yersinia aldovae]CNK62252.1 Uncharacterised protein [Yersinia aldovae]CNK78639.1 Uncharacterised protein [Yersinia aldovae]